LRDRNENADIRQHAAGALAAIRSTGVVRGIRAFAADPDEDPALRAYTTDLLSGLPAW